MSHAGYLREFWDGPPHEVVELTRGLQALGRDLDDVAPSGAMAFAAPRLDALSSGADRAILGLVLRLAVRPRSTTAAHLEPLRAAGLSDTAIHDVVHVACCFSYMNRLADGLGVGIEERKRAWAVELFGEAAVAEHLGWVDGT